MTCTAPPAALTITAALLAVLVGAYEAGGTLPLAGVAADDVAALKARGLVWIDAEVIDLSARGLWTVLRAEAPEYVGQVEVVGG